MALAIGIESGGPPWPAAPMLGVAVLSLVGKPVSLFVSRIGYSLRDFPYPPRGSPNRPAIPLYVPRRFPLILPGVSLHAMGASTRGTKQLPYLPQRAIRSNKGVAMRPATLLALTFALLTTGAGAPAFADIYSFIDSAGVTHFTNVPVDTRYRLLLATPPEERAARPENWLARSAEFDLLIERAARSRAVRPELVRAVIVVESAFNPHAVSRRGAIGLMQLLPETARRYGVADAFDPEQNITAGVLYLHDLLTRYGNNLELTLAAYNAGEDAVERYGRSIPPFAETRHYVPTVLRIYRSLLSQQRRG